jgi:hypothetical protein
MTIAIPLGLALGLQRLREVHMKSPSRGVYLTILPLLSLTVGTACAEPQFLLAQAPIQIPSDAELERMERQGIVTPPLYDGRGANDGSIAAENRQMEEQAHRIDEKLLRGGICRDC